MHSAFELAWYVIGKLFTFDRKILEPDAGLLYGLLLRRLLRPL